MRNLFRDETAYRAEVDHLHDEAQCVCSSCGARWRYDQLCEIGDCSLTPGDPSPAGRCVLPDCDSLCYVVAADAEPGWMSRVYYQFNPNGDDASLIARLEKWAQVQAPALLSEIVAVLGTQQEA